MKWLFKEEPSSYSYETFVKDGRTTWAGVKNPLAQKHLRGVRKGDLIFYYHTGNQSRGRRRPGGERRLPDPKDRTGKAVVVDIVPERSLQRRSRWRDQGDKGFATFPDTTAAVVRHAGHRSGVGGHREEGEKQGVNRR